MDISKIFSIGRDYGVNGLYHKILAKLSHQHFPFYNSDYNNWQYYFWLKKYYPHAKLLKEQVKLQADFAYRPLISIVVPVYNVAEKWLRACLNSVLAQTYDYWELCIVDDASTAPQVKKVLLEYQQRDARIKVVFREQNGHISVASNSALELTSGEYIGLLDDDDFLWPNALFEVVKALNKNSRLDFIYTDEDKLELDGKHVEPFFKPDFSWDYFLSGNYITHFSVLRTKIVKKIGGFRVGYEGSQDYDLFLRFLEIIPEKNIVHLPMILYSWRKIPGSTAVMYESKSYAQRASLQALRDFVQRNHLAAKVQLGIQLATFNLQYKIIGQPLVSIIIPTKNAYRYIKKCVNSVLKKTTYQNIEILVVDTGSTDDKVWRLYENLKQDRRIKILIYDQPFNYSAVNNFAVARARGQYVLLLNNDTEVITGDWIEQMLQHAQRQEIGAVGAKLLYASGNVQHVGIVLGLGASLGQVNSGVAGHIFTNIPDVFFIQGNSKDVVRNYSAVTAACLMVSKEKFLAVGGLEEKLRIAFNDVDFNLKLQQAGYRNVFTPYAKLYHYESLSVGKPDRGTRDMEEFTRETLFMQKKWLAILHSDPYYNPNLSLVRADNIVETNPKQLGRYNLNLAKQFHERLTADLKKIEEARFFQLAQQFGLVEKPSRQISKNMSENDYKKVNTSMVKTLRKYQRSIWYGIWQFFNKIKRLVSQTTDEG